MVPGNGKPIANPSMVLREEFDDWSILIDPDTGEAYGLNSLSAFIWRHLDGRHTVQNIHAELRKVCENMPEYAEDSIKDFVQDLVEHGLAGYERQ